MEDKNETWHEFRARFGRGLTWREAFGYIRDDRVMKARLANLVGIAIFGSASIVALALGQREASAVFLLAIIALGFIGYNV